MVNKKIYITEEQHNRVFNSSVGACQEKHKSLVESMQNGFSLAKLDELSRNEYFDATLDYAYKYLGEPIGQGSDRIVFEIGDDEVIKLDEWCKQNEKEWNIVKTLEKSFPTLFPRVYQHASDFSWIICERVLPFEIVDCSAILGIPYGGKGIKKFDNKGNDYSNYIKPIRDDFSFQNEHGTEFDISLLGFMDWAQRVILKDITYKEEYFQFKKLISKSEFLKELFRFMSSVGGSKDLYYSNFGIAIREGKPKIVILDVGYEDLMK